ncbi:MAG: ABC transporter permease [Verrucomicrobiales bacterium]|nr:ABC transporter permease [Verrucomicrobiales bacterium]
MLPFSYAVRNLFRDPWKLIQKVLGSALVVFLIFSAASFNKGMENVLRASGSSRNVILLSAGSEESVERSEVMVQSEEQITAGVRGIESRLGAPAVSGEVHYMGNIYWKEKGESQALLRGVTPAAFEVHREVRLLEGRYPQPGEILVGKLAWHTMGAEEADFARGREIVFEDQAFQISGVFEAPGTVMESELWLDRNDLMTLVQRDSLSCVVIRLESGKDFPEVDLFTKQRLDLELVAITEADYYRKLARFYGPIRAMTWLTAGLVAAGAVFGGLNMLYASFSSRIREMGTLQAVGFSRWAILVSLIQESLLATLMGTLLAAFLATLLLEGQTVPFSIGTFRLTLTGVVIFFGLGTGLLLGTLGALPPAIRCLRAPLPVALRSQ